MAIIDLPGIGAMSGQLLRLLSRAEEIKPAFQSEPPLSASAFAGQQGIAPLPGFEHSHAALVEVAARRIFYDAVSSCDIKDPQFCRIWNLLDILSICGDQDQCPPELVWWLIEELIEGQSVEGCQQVFDKYLDSRRTRLIAHHFLRKQLIILRGFNDLLRRVSRAEDAVFCGRILIYLFQSFDFGSRGAVNHRGDYNVDNVTAYDTHIGFSQDAIMQESASTPVQDISVTDPAGKVETSDSKSTTREENEPALTAAQLYPLFWSLQRFFSNPPQVMDPAHLNEFKTNVEAALRKFKEVPTIETGKSASKRSFDMMEDDKDVDNAYNPKYLTSPDLFELELSDLAFQRDFLVQALILIDFIQDQNSKTGTAKAVVDAPAAQADQWTKDMKKSIERYLRDGPDGAQYSRMVDTVLTREKNWVRWKANGCPIISKDAVPSADYKKSKDQTKRLSTNKRMDAVPMGTLNLQFLSDSDREQTLDSLSVLERFPMPDLKNLVDKVRNTDLDLEMASGDEAKLLQNAKEGQTWSALRSAVRSAYPRLEKIEGGRKIEALISIDEPESTAREGMAPSSEDPASPHNEARNPDESTNNLGEADPIDNGLVEMQA